MEEELKRRTLRTTDETWNRLRLAAAMRSNEEGDRVSMNELVRRGIARELDACDSPDDYTPPPGFGTDGKGEDG